MCDGRVQCLELEDEASCCGYNQFKCGSGECISALRLCDRTAHCEDGSDETTYCR